MKIILSLWFLFTQLRSSSTTTCADKVQQTRNWLQLREQRGNPISLEGNWHCVVEDAFMWEVLSISPKHDSEDLNDYALLGGSGACLASTSVRYFGRFDSNTGILNTTRKAKGYEKQLLVLFPEDEPVTEDSIPTSLFLVPLNLIQYGDFKFSFDSLKWRNPMKDSRLFCSEQPNPDPEIQKFIEHRYLYQPHQLTSILPPDKLNVVYPSDEFFVESHRYLFFKSHGDGITPNLPAPTLLQMYRDFIPLPVTKRFLMKNSRNQDLSLKLIL